ncbi:bifunctional UDP-2,4-diacetamido-2,4,6-trideoxy-beta-L-altropyranose hydrolase/GNAT family N-acetyltransferase [Oryzihumus leptocrescens]|uniref:bifunctional UDP-2,4-diacetamido-2,4,6-trideoxy-beta-L-altropyranose hydrolase/GNAT family N-acetyltransferase n=1 Tax=Oryzihumus leptocrescens TaxID=297536 RepID=UPI00114D91A4|nr:bifunctional UDP-2,4-diacetamido-2,4,6-trideoxy-beta-L-altropyranose hydrolase/GNAT family N-acetyltransferase [Oryzihumus leptocrescens]
MGHVIRSVALAEEALARGHDVLLAGHFEGDFVRRQVELSGARVLHLDAPLPGDAVADPSPLLSDHPADVLHCDIYDLVPGTALRAGLPAHTVLSNMEDSEFGRRPADVVVDPTWGSEAVPRPADGSRWLLRGADYAAMRRQVRTLRRDGAGRTGEPPLVLVVMGGTDPVGLAPRVLEALGQTGLDLRVTVIATGDNAERVRAVAAEAPRLDVLVSPPVDDIAELMSRQDLVVSAAGTSVWEMCCLGVPMALVCAVANQGEGYARVVAAGAAEGLGDAAAVSDPAATAAAVGKLLRDEGRRQELARNAATIVDGLGAWRIVETWEQALTAGPPTGPPPADWSARVATLEDADRLWRWRNDAGTRAASRSREEVPWPDHLAWLRSSLGRADRELLVVADGRGNVGTVRWDESIPGEWEVSITVAPERRGQSLARHLLTTAEEHLRRHRDVTAYLAVVHRDNHPSRRLFAGAGYVPDLPPDGEGFMRFKKSARLPSSLPSTPQEYV